MSRKEILEFLTKSLSNKLPYDFDSSSLNELLVANIPTYIRINELRITPEKLRKNLEKRGIVLEEVPKINIVFKILKGKKIGFLPEHLAGYFYIQDLASVLAVLALNPQKGEMILDACAAPGGKSTLISQLQKNIGTVVANEIDKKRVVSLKSNIERMGASNIIVTRNDMTKTPSDWWKNRFDKILVDAPCTGTGLLPKKEEKISPLKDKNVKEMSSLQKKILSTTYELLKPGGELVYSTCSFTINENEEVIKWFLEKEKTADLIKLKVPILPDPGFLIGNEILDKKISEFTGRYFPKKHHTIGFFISKLKKQEK